MATQRTSRKLKVRTDLEPYLEVVDPEEGMLRCKVKDCKSKNGEPTTLKYTKDHGWWNCVRHLVSFRLKSEINLNNKLACWELWKCDSNSNYRWIYMLQLNIHKIKLTDAPDKDKGSIMRHFLPTFKKKPSFKGSYKRNDPKQLSFERDLLDFVAIDGVPLDITRRPGFVQLVQNRDPNLRIPSRRDVGRKLKSSCDRVSF